LTALLARGLERLDFAIVLPKLYVVIAYKALGVFFRELIVWASKRYRPEKATIYPNNVRPISGHLRPVPPPR
jgi:hypothetical protein